MWQGLVEVAARGQVTAEQAATEVARRLAVVPWLHRAAEALAEIQAAAVFDLAADVLPDVEISLGRLEAQVQRVRMWLDGDRVR